MPALVKPVSWLLISVAIAGVLQVVAMPDLAAVAGSGEYDKTVTVHASANHSGPAHVAPRGQSPGNWGNQCGLAPDVLANEASAIATAPWYDLACTTYHVSDHMIYLLETLRSLGPKVTPVQEAENAESSMTLPSPTIFSDPTGSTFVNLPTWLWISPTIWHPWTTTATAGDVTASATATPIDVEFSMGDGGSEICRGPGSVFNANQAISLQGTPCSYTYHTSSADQPTANGNANDASFLVTATVTWAVSWVAVGAAGGGTLPSLTTASTTSIRVQQIESVVQP
jgi:hypothetical protein